MALLVAIKEFLGRVHTRASDPGPELMRVRPGSEVLFTQARRSLSDFNPHW